MHISHGFICLIWMTTMARVVLMSACRVTLRPSLYHTVQYSTESLRSHCYCHWPLKDHRSPLPARHLHLCVVHFTLTLQWRAPQYWSITVKKKTDNKTFTKTINLWTDLKSESRPQFFEIILNYILHGLIDSWNDEYCVLISKFGIRNSILNDNNTVLYQYGTKLFAEKRRPQLLILTGIFFFLL